MRRVHFRYSNFCMVMWTWVGLEACLIWRCIDVIVVRVKISRGIVPFSPMGIDSADTNQPSNGENCMDKSHILPNNPARQYQQRRLCTNRGGKELERPELLCTLLSYSALSWSLLNPPDWYIRCTLLNYTEKHSIGKPGLKYHLSVGKKRKDAIRTISCKFTFKNNKCV